MTEYHPYESTNSNQTYHSNSNANVEQSAYSYDRDDIYDEDDTYGYDDISNDYHNRLSKEEYKIFRLGKIVDYTKHFEGELKDIYGADGSGLHTNIDSIEKN